MHKPLQRMAKHYQDSFIFIKLFGNSNEQTKRLFKNVLKVSGRSGMAGKSVSYRLVPQNPRYSSCNAF